MNVGILLCNTLLSSHDVDKDVVILDADETDDRRKWSRRNWWNGIKDVAKELCVTLLFFPQIEWNDHMFMVFICSTEEKWHVTKEILNDSRDVLFAQIKWNEMLQKRYSIVYMTWLRKLSRICIYVYFLKRVFGWQKSYSSMLWIFYVDNRALGVITEPKEKKTGYYICKKQSKHSTAN